MSAVDDIAAYLAHLKTGGNHIDQIIFDELPNGEGMSATDELRRLLDERGVEHWDTVGITEYRGENNRTVRCYARPEPLTLDVAIIAAPPEQAVEATLGRGTCRMGVERTSERIDGDEEHLLECSECGGRRWWLAHMMPSYCPDCGRKVVDA